MMPQETVTADQARSTLLQRYATLTATVTMTKEEVEEAIHTEIWRKDWEEVLRLLALLPEPPSRGTIIECLLFSIHTATSEVFRALLDILPAGEYAANESYPVDWSPTGEIYRRLKWEINVQGTMVMHAVAKNRPECLLALLERGNDVNGASPEAASALLMDVQEDGISIGYGREFNPFYAYSTRPENCVSLLRWDTTPDDIAPLDWPGATPLALAVLMGHSECARILVEHGAWLEEAPSVSSAMYLFWREQDVDYQAARTEVLAEGDHVFHRPVLWAIGRNCSARQLQMVLETYVYSEEELTQAALKMLRGFHDQHLLWNDLDTAWQQLHQKLCLLGKNNPAVLREPEVAGEILKRCAAGEIWKIEMFLPFFRGETLDLSWLGGGGFRMLYLPKGKAMLRQLAEHCTLTLDRDEVSLGMNINQNVKLIRLLCQSVRLLPPTMDRGISGLTLEILRSGDLRLLRQAIQKGWIPPEESTAELLAAQREMNLSPECRMMLLAADRSVVKADCSPLRLPSEEKHRWFVDKIPEGEMPLLTEGMDWFYPSVYHNGGQWMAKAAGESWRLHSVFFAACMEGRTDIVKRWLDTNPWQDLQNIHELYHPVNRSFLVTTPLFAAAFAGQKEMVELLLQRGAPVREDLWGYPSVFVCQLQSGEKLILPCLPMLAAALGDHWDIVKRLLSHGAVCDWTAPYVGKIWKQFRKDRLEDIVGRELGENV